MSDYLDPQNEELLKDFFDEANLQVDSFEQNILALEKNAADGDAVDEMFRAAHTLKGAAATVQMQELTSFTHTVEDVLDEIRSGNTAASEYVVETLLQSIDVIKQMLNARAAGQVYQDDPSVITAALKEAAGLSGEGHDSLERQGTPATETAAGTNGDISDFDALELQNSVADGEKVYRITVEFDKDNPMNTVGGIQVFASLKSLGRIIRTRPDFDELYRDIFYPVVDYFVSSSANPEELERSVTIPDVTLSVNIRALDLSVEGSGASEEGVPEPAPSADEEVSVEPDDFPRRKSSPVSTGGSILRVDSKRIDSLLNLVSEAVINKASFNQLSQAFADTEEEIANSDLKFKDQLREVFDSIPDLVAEMENGATPATIKDHLLESYGGLFDSFKNMQVTFKASFNQFKTTAQNLGRITGELQEGVMQIRMVPISQIFSRFPRLVRDVSKTLGKKVRLEIEGQDTELDKSVIEDLLDPLIHCVRNAVDHGIEAPDDRVKAGKEETGAVFLKASNEGNLIAIEVGDDGQGIDVESVHRKAVDRGLIHPSKRLSDIEAFNLIFEPGFSTAQKVTDISGRGVGLDVVKRQIEKLSGSVSVWSNHGEGSRITIKLPLTLAIIQGLLIRVGSETYAIPITSVLESQRISADEIKLIDNYEVMSIRDEVVSLLRMDRLFGISSDSDNTRHYVVVVGSEDKKVGLVVDSLIGEEDVVIKPLKDRFTNSPGIAGATILGDGRVALIIDVSQLLELGLERSQNELQRRAQTIV